MEAWAKFSSFALDTMENSGDTILCTTRPCGELWLVEGWPTITSPPTTTRHMGELCIKLRHQNHSGHNNILILRGTFPKWIKRMPFFFFFFFFIIFFLSHWFVLFLKNIFIWAAIYIVILTQQISLYFYNFLYIGQNKIINNETVTNYN